MFSTIYCLVSGMQKYSDYLPLVIFVLIIVSYFLPWFSGAGDIERTVLGGTYHYHTESSINGLGRGIAESWYDHNYSAASLVWEYGWLNIIGLVIVIIAAAICALPLLGVDLGAPRRKEGQDRISSRDHIYASRFCLCRLILLG